MTTGGSVIALMYEGGVVMASDTLLSYGSLAKTPNITRSFVLGDQAAICASGDFADFQSIVATMESNRREYVIQNDADTLGPSEMFTYLQRTLYEKRCDFKPALCTVVMVGWNKREKKPFLGVVDSIGTNWTAPYAGTMFGRLMAVPLLRQHVETNGLPKTRDEAIAILESCMRVLFYRECRMVNRIQIVDASAHGIHVSAPYTLDTDWDYEGFHFNRTAILKI